MTAMVRPTRPPNIHAGLLRPGLLHRGRRAVPRAAPSTPSLSVHSAGAKPRSVLNLSLYRDGRRLEACTTLQQLFAARREHPGCVSWVGLYRPSHDDVALLAREFDLHELAVEDAINAHQRPKLERYGDTLFVVLHAARYLDDVEEVEFGELHVFVGPDFVITMRHSESPDLDRSPGAHGERTGPAGPGARGGPVRDPGPRRRRLRPGRRRPGERHRRDRDRGLLRRRRSLPAHLRAVPRGHRLPARHPPAEHHARRPCRTASTSTRSTRSCAATCATSPTTTCRPATGSTGSARSCATCSP